MKFYSGVSSFPTRLALTSKSIFHYLYGHNLKAWLYSSDRKFSTLERSEMESNIDSEVI